MNFGSADSYARARARSLARETGTIRAIEGKSRSGKNSDEARIRREVETRLANTSRNQHQRGVFPRALPAAG